MNTRLNNELTTSTDKKEMSKFSSNLREVGMKTNSMSTDLEQLKKDFDTFLAGKSERTLEKDNIKITVKKAGDTYTATREQLFEDKILLKETFGLRYTADGSGSNYSSNIEMVKKAEDGKLKSMDGVSMSKKELDAYDAAMSSVSKLIFPKDRKSQEERSRMMESRFENLQKDITATVK